MAMVTCRSYGQNSRCSSVPELVTSGEIFDALSVLAEDNAEYLAEILEGHDAVSCHWQSPMEGCMGAGGGGGGTGGGGCMGLPSLTPSATVHHHWPDPGGVSVDLGGTDMFYPRGDEGGETSSSPGYDTGTTTLWDPFPSSVADFTHNNNHMNLKPEFPVDVAYSTGFGTAGMDSSSSRTHQGTEEFSPHDMSSGSSHDGQQSDSELSPRPPGDRRLRRREQNRQAARRCRQRKKEQSQVLVKDYYHLLSANSELQAKLQLLESEKRRLEEIYEAHLSTCAM